MEKYYGTEFSKQLKETPVGGFKHLEIKICKTFFLIGRLIHSFEECTSDL